MTDEGGSKNWLQSLPGILTALAAVLTAIAGLVAALSGWFSSETVAPAVQNCIPGYVWREAVRDDHVCVTLETHTRTIQDNELAASRRNPSGGNYGPDTCKVGYVWRDAFDGDRVCVTVETRAQAKEDNEQAAIRVKR